MDIKNIIVNDEQVLICPENRSPIFFINLTAEIVGAKSKAPTRYIVEKLVVKGTLDEIKNSDQTKRDFLKRVLDGRTNVNKHVNEFDLSRVNIIKVDIIKGLGYGVKSN